MTNKKDGGPAFPFAVPERFYAAHEGMSLRDWFAGQIASGLAAYSGTSGINYGPVEIAERAYQVADAIIKAREAGNEL